MKVLTDLDYGHGRFIDLYLPETADAPLPLVIWSHGSAFTAANGRAGADYVATRLTPYGVAVAGVAVPGSRTDIFPAQLDAVRDAVNFLQDNADTWRLDPDRFAAMGESSGGWVASMAGLATDMIRAVVAIYPPTDLAAMNRHAQEAGLTPAADCGRLDTRGTAAGNLAMDHDLPDSPESRLLGGPVQDNLDVARAASPLHYVKESAPPFLILHGELDPLVPWHQGRALAEALAAADTDVELIRFPHAGHAVWRTWLDDPELKAEARSFVAREGLLADGGPTDPTWNTLVAFLARSGVIKSALQPVE